MRRPPRRRRAGLRHAPALRRRDDDRGAGAVGVTRLNVRPREEADRAAVAALLAERHSARVARLGRLEQPLEHPELVAELDGKLAGVLTYVIDGDECEILTLHAAAQWRGAGTALIERVERVAAEHGCRRLWLVTTNDNVDALRFYQRRGFRLARINAGAIDEARASLKPEIPEVGNYGIPIRDELILEKEIA